MFGLLMVTGASVTASLLVVQMAVLPLLFKYSKSVQRKMVFCNCLNFPRDLDYANPASVDVIGGRHFNIDFFSAIDNCHITLGVWHIVPTSMFEDVFFESNHAHLCKTMDRELRRSKHPILIYCHGYGDSSSVRPTEAGVVEDLFQVYSWLLKSIDKGHSPMIILWGHSLGTAVAASMVSHMSKVCQEKDMSMLPLPHALVLEAPFNNLIEEIKKHPFSKLVSWLPYYKLTFIKPFTSSSEYVFSTDKYLASVPDIPILMLHAVEDRIVPYELAVKLYKDISCSRCNGGAPLVLYTFKRGSGVGHNNICQAPDLPCVVRDFLKMLRK